MKMSEYDRIVDQICQREQMKLHPILPVDWKQYYDVMKPLVLDPSDMPTTAQYEAFYGTTSNQAIKIRQPGPSSIGADTNTSLEFINSPTGSSGARSFTMGDGQTISWDGTVLRFTGTTDISPPKVDEVVDELWNEIKDEL